MMGGMGSPITQAAMDANPNWDATSGSGEVPVEGYGWFHGNVDYSSGETTPPSSGSSVGQVILIGAALFFAFALLGGRR